MSLRRSGQPEPSAPPAPVPPPPHRRPPPYFRTFLASMVAMAAAQDSPVGEVVNNALAEFFHVRPATLAHRQWWEHLLDMGFLAVVYFVGLWFYYRK
jgi:hypothetical protein